MSQLKMTIDRTNELSKINKEIYGHFAEHLGRCIYGGIYVGKDSPIPSINGYRKDVVEALKAIKVPVLRWPGGCFADTYHWKDGIGSPEERRKIVNTNWGGVTEDNSFGTHEFLDFCELIGCDAYVAVNLGSGTVQEAAEWVEYMTSSNSSPMTDLRKKNGRDKPWNVKDEAGRRPGNESWGCGGGMSPDYYMDLYKQFQQFIGHGGKIACGPNSSDYNWTDTLMRRSYGYFQMKGLSLHYYTIPTGDWGKKGSSVDFTKDEYYSTIANTWYMEELLNRHGATMDKYDIKKEVGLVVDEWGIWTDVIDGTNPGFLYQQNSMRDAILASVNLNLFNEHSDRVMMANIAQMVNVLQSVILTEGERMVKTPTYHVFDMYKDHMEAKLVYSHIENKQILEGRYLPAVSQSVSVDAEGKLHITISNASLDEDFDIDCVLPRTEFKTATAKILTAKYDTCNTFDNPDAVKPEVFTDVKIDGESLKFTLPKCSVLAIELC